MLLISYREDTQCSASIPVSFEGDSLSIKMKWSFKLFYLMVGIPFE